MQTLEENQSAPMEREEAETRRTPLEDAQEAEHGTVERSDSPIVSAPESDAHRDPHTLSTPSTTEEPVATASAAQEGALDIVLDDESIREMAIDVIKTIFDPEIPVNIWELGLIYDVTVPQPGYVHVLMTLTAPNCPAAQSLPGEVTQKLIQTPGIRDAEVEITFEPAWEMSRMSEAARLQLGLM